MSAPTLPLLDPHSCHPPAPLASPRIHLLLGGLLVLVVCLAMRVNAVVQTDVIQRDGVTFIRMAQQFATDPLGAIHAFKQHAGYPALIVGVRAVGTRVGLTEGLAGWELSGQMISVVAGTVATMGVWALGGLTFGWRTAWVGTVMFAMGRKWMSLGADVMSDATAMSTLIWGVVLAVLAVRAKGMKQTLGWAAGAGVLAGLGYLVRPEGLGTAIVAVLLFGIWTVFRCWSWKRGTAAMLTCVLATLVVAGPYMAAIGGLTKKKAIGGTASAPMVIEGGPVLASLSLADWGGPSVLAAGRGPASDRPGVRALTDQTIEAMQPVVFFFFVVWCVVTVIHFSVPARWRMSFIPFPTSDGAPGAVAIGIIVVVYSLVAVWLHATAGYLDWRHCMPLAFALVPLAGAGMIAMVDFLACLASPFRLQRLSVEQFVICQWCWVMPVVLWGAGYQAFTPLHGGKEYVQDAAAALKRQAAPGDTALSNTSWVLYYAQVPGRTMDTTVADLPAVVRRVEEMNPKPKWLIISERWLPEGHQPLDKVLLAPRFKLFKPFPQKAVRGDEADVLYIYRVQWEPEPATTTPSASVDAAVSGKLEEGRQ